MEKIIEVHPPRQIHSKRDVRAWFQRFLLPCVPLRWLSWFRLLRGQPRLATKVLVWGQGRVGSTALISCFPTEQVHQMDEVLGPHLKPWSPMWLPDDAAAFLDKLALTQGAQRAAIAHVKPEHVGTDRHLVVPFLQQAHALGWRVVHLERRNSLAQGHSFLRARSLGIYNTEDPDAAREASGRKFEPSPEAIQAAVWRNEVNNHFNRESLSASGIPFVRVSYESLFEGSAEETSAALQALGESLALGFALQPPTTKKVSPALPMGDQGG